MHGLINQAIERFARATYGNGFWERVCRRRNLPVLTFEAMQSYDPEVTEALLDGMAQVLGKPRGDVASSPRSASETGHASSLRRNRWSHASAAACEEVEDARRVETSVDQGHHPPAGVGEG